MSFDLHVVQFHSSLPSVTFQMMLDRTVQTSYSTYSRMKMGGLYQISEVYLVKVYSILCIIGLRLGNNKSVLIISHVQHIFMHAVISFLHLISRSHYHPCKKEQVNFRYFSLKEMVHVQFSIAYFLILWLRFRCFVIHMEGKQDSIHCFKLPFGGLSLEFSGEHAPGGLEHGYQSQWGLIDCQLEKTKCYAICLLQA